MCNNSKVTHKIQRTIGLPSNTTFIKYIQNNNTPNRPVIISEIKSMEGIFGIDVVPIKGKKYR